MIPSEDSSAGKQRLGHISSKAVPCCASYWRKQPKRRHESIRTGDVATYTLAMRRHKEHCQGSDGASDGDSAVLDVAKWLRVFAVSAVRFVRGTARNRTWCEVEHRPLDWASCLPSREEFEEAIMVKVQIEEMYGSD